MMARWTWPISKHAPSSTYAGRGCSHTNLRGIQIKSNPMSSMDHPQHPIVSLFSNSHPVLIKTSQPVIQAIGSPAPASSMKRHCQPTFRTSPLQLPLTTRPPQFPITVKLPRGTTTNKPSTTLHWPSLFSNATPPPTTQSLLIAWWACWRRLTKLWGTRATSLAKRTSRCGCDFATGIMMDMSSMTNTVSLWWDLWRGQASMSINDILTLI